MRKPIIVLFLFISSIFLLSMQLCSIINFNGSKPIVVVLSNFEEISSNNIVIEGIVVDPDHDLKYVKAWLYENNSIYGIDSEFENDMFSINLDLSNLGTGVYNIYVQGYDERDNKSDIIKININYSSGGGSSNLLVNGYFNQSGWIDSDITYIDSSTVSTYLNNSNGDYLPGWTFTIWNPEEDHPKIDIASGSIRMYTTNPNANGSSMALYQDTSTVTSLKTGSGKTIKISFKINSFAGGPCSSPYFEAPIKITIKADNIEYLIAAFTNLSGSASGGYLQTGLNIGQTYTFSFILPTKHMNGDDIPSDKQIQEFRITCNGWTWDVFIYYIEIY